MVLTEQVVEFQFKRLYVKSSADLRKIFFKEYLAGSLE